MTTPRAAKGAPRAPKGYRIVTRGVKHRGDFCMNDDGTEPERCFAPVGSPVHQPPAGYTIRKVARPRRARGKRKERRSK